MEKINNAESPDESQMLFWQCMKNLEKNLNHDFIKPELLELALSHSSWANEQPGMRANNERLEFLGDAVLELCVSQELYFRFPDMREGMLTQIRSQLVNENTLAELGKGLGIEKAIRLGKGEERQDGRKKKSVLADALEAVIGALFLECGFNATQKIVSDIYKDMWNKISLTLKPQDPKTLLQELCQKEFGSTPLYHLVGREGPPHARIFNIRLTLPNNEIIMATSASQKKAEQQAASIALKKFQND